MKWFLDLKISGKLRFGFAAVTILAVVAGITGMLYILSFHPGGLTPAALTGLIIVGALVLLVIVLAVLMCKCITWSIAGPMRNNGLLADRVSTGNLDTSDIVAGMTSWELKTMDRADEIGDFTRSFKTLLNKVRASLQFIEKLADGDLTVAASVQSDSDQLGKGLTTLVTNFHRLVSAIMTAIDQVAAGAGLVAESSHTLAQGVTHQASTVQELTASVEHISLQTRQNAENAEKADSLAKSARDTASAGNVRMQDMLRAMEDISASSGSINKVIKVIDDIAFQTNILALNAAVEAARAGQHGKGFAVVAEEVRSLASKSASAARETTALIDSSIRKVETGTKIAAETAQALMEIVSQIGRAAELIGSIAAASSAQAHGIEQLNTGITQLSQVIQMNTATAEESAAASEEFSAQAAQMKETISIFKLTQTSAQTGRRVASHIQAKSSSNAPDRRPALSDGAYGKY